jgi:hypothetical protein
MRHSAHTAHCPQEGGIGRRGANPANKINFYSNENTSQFTQGVFTTIFNTAMKTRLSAVLRW